MSNFVDGLDRMSLINNATQEIIENLIQLKERLMRSNAQQELLLHQRLAKKEEGYGKIFEP